MFCTAEGEQTAERSRPTDVATSAVYFWQYPKESGKRLHR